MEVSKQRIYLYEMHLEKRVGFQPSPSTEREGLVLQGTALDSGEIE